MYRHALPQADRPAPRTSAQKAFRFTLLTVPGVVEVVQRKAGGWRVVVRAYGRRITEGEVRDRLRAVAVVDRVNELTALAGQVFVAVVVPREEVSKLEPRAEIVRPLGGGEFATSFGSGR